MACRQPEVKYSIRIPENDQKIILENNVIFLSLSEINLELAGIIINFA
jgi:hypothetical protein